jgi:hypothetical protein
MEFWWKIKYEIMRTWGCVSDAHGGVCLRVCGCMRVNYIYKEKRGKIRVRTQLLCACKCFGYT